MSCGAAPESETEIEAKKEAATETRSETETEARERIEIETEIAGESLIDLEERKKRTTAECSGSQTGLKT